MNEKINRTQLPPVNIIVSTFNTQGIRVGFATRLSENPLATVEQIARDIRSSKFPWGSKQRIARVTFDVALPLNSDSIVQ